MVDYQQREQNSHEPDEPRLGPRRGALLYMPRPRSIPKPIGGWNAHSLTRREEEVVALVFRGIIGKRAAQELGISYETLRRHEYNIRQKLGVSSSLELVTSAYRQGAVQLWTEESK